jgi:Ricin-type beta-trefoil lectin domain-like
VVPPASTRRHRRTPGPGRHGGALWRISAVGAVAALLALPAAEAYGEAWPGNGHTSASVDGSTSPGVGDGARVIDDSSFGATVFGGSAGTGRLPAAVAVAAAPGLTCSGDGNSGNRVKVVYVFETGSDRFTAVEPAIRQAIWEAQTNINDSARRDGGQRFLRFVHDANCQAVIDKVELPPGSIVNDNNFGRDFTALLQARGYNATNRVYLLVAEGWNGCGNAEVVNDTSPGTGNQHNFQTNYARIAVHPDGGCLGGHEVTHELAHVFGGLLPGAPHNDGSGHCTDGQETLCQDTAILACPDPIEIRMWDCGRDDYFGVTPQGSWLPTHWNAARDSTYLDAGSAVPALTAVPPLPPQYLSAVDVQGTSIALAFRRPGDARGITDYQILNGGTVLATIPANLNQSTVQVGGLRPNTSLSLTIRSRVVVNGTTRVSVNSQPMSVRTTSTTTPAGVPVNGAIMALANDVVTPDGPHLALEVGFSSTAEDAQMVEWPRNDALNQQWLFTTDGNGFRLLSQRSDKCLTVLGSSTANGANVVQETCAGLASQRWLMIPVTGLTYQLKASHSNLCLQAQGLGTAPLTPLVQGTCNTAEPTQRWTVGRLA